MHTGFYVRVIRVRSREDASGTAPKRGEPHVGSWIEGTLTTPIRVGCGFRVQCVLFNGQICRRTYQGSSVVAIKGDLVTTTTRVEYKVLKVPKFDPIGSLRAWE
jgi:hypothetical protein